MRYYQILCKKVNKNDRSKSMKLEQFGFKKKFLTENESNSTDNVSASPDEEKTKVKQTQIQTRCRSLLAQILSQIKVHAFVPLMKVVTK